MTDEMTERMVAADCKSDTFQNACVVDNCNRVSDTPNLTDTTS